MTTRKGSMNHMNLDEVCVKGGGGATCLRKLGLQTPEHLPMYFLAFLTQAVSINFYPPRLSLKLKLLLSVTWFSRPIC